MNHQQMIKLRGKHDAAREVKAIIQEQIREKSKEMHERNRIRKVTNRYNHYFRNQELKEEKDIPDVKN